MVIGRSEDRDNPWGPMVLGHHLRCLGPDPRTPSGPAVIRPHTKAGHMTAVDQTFVLPRPCQTGAVHIWTLASAREALNIGCRREPPLGNGTLTGTNGELISSRSVSPLRVADARTRCRS